MGQQSLIKIRCNFQDVISKYSPVGQQPSIKISYNFQDIITNNFDYKGYKGCKTSQCKEIAEKLKGCDERQKMILADYISENNVDISELEIVASDNNYCHVNHGVDKQTILCIEKRFFTYYISHEERYD